MEPASKIACSCPGCSDGDGDDKAVEDAATTRSNAALELMILARFLAMLHSPNIQPHKRARPTFITYDPARQSTAFVSGAAGRPIRLPETPSDTLAPHKSRSRRQPRASRPPPVRSSPPVPLSRRCQEPCLHDRKDPDKRQLDDQKNRKCARLAEVLDAAEKMARETFLMINNMKKERREKELRRLIEEARAKLTPPVQEGEEPRDLQSKTGHCGSDMHGNADEHWIARTDRSKPDNGSSGGAPGRAAAGKRERPVEFDDPEQGDDDPSDLDQIMSKFAGLGMEDFDLDDLLGSMLHIS